MKKIIGLFLLMLVSIGMYAQKSYVLVYSYNKFNNLNPMATTSCKVAGDVPNGIESSYLSLTDALTALGRENYAIESVNVFGPTEYCTTCTGSNTNYYTYTIILSKSSNASLKIETISADEDSEVYEIARYNLQGKPIDVTERGIQIIVYSNYTTKIIFVE